MSEAFSHPPSTAGGNAPAPLPVDKLKAERVELKLKKMPKWQLQRNGSTLSRRLRFATPGAALAFAGLVTSLADRAGLRPRIQLEGGEMHLSLTTAGGLTRADLALARRIDDQI